MMKKIMEAADSYGTLTERTVMRVLHEVRGDGRLELSELKRLVEKDDSLTEKKPLVDHCFQQIQNNMNSVVMVAPASSIFESPDSEYVIIVSKPLHLRRVSEKYEICKNASYAFQPSAFCDGSGFFVKEKEGGVKVIATAAHLLVRPGVAIEKMRFIHGIQIKKPGDFSYNIAVHKSQVYKPVQENGQLPPSDYELFYNSSDWALVKVKHAYEQFINPKNPPSLVSIQATPVEESTHLYATGHGLGLPLKISFDGEVMPFASRNVSTGMKEKAYYESKLTLLGGNSGSPVFSAESHQLVGIYMRGVKKLHLTENYKCLRVKNETDSVEGQECLCVHNGTNFSKRLELI
ncbi:MAG: serine protease [Saprospiraceae bacterium]